MGSQKTKKAGAKAKQLSAEKLKMLATWERLRAAGEPPDVAAKKAGATPGMFYYWKSIREGKPWGNRGTKSKPTALVLNSPAPASTKAGDRRRPREPEILELRRQVEALKTERDLLTQALAIFARRIS
jgi:hypothetical protein